MPNKELQELLSVRFDRHTHTTNESVWSAIESQLDAAKSDRAGFWFWILNGIAATVFVGLIFQSTIRTESLSNLNQSQVSKSTVKQKVKIELVPIKSEVPNEEKSVFSNEKPPLSESLSIVSIINPPVPSKTATPLLNPLINSQESSGSSQTTNSSLNDLIVANNNIYLVDNLKKRAFLTLFVEPKIHEALPKSTSKINNGFFQRLPVHLGFEFSYLRKTRIGDEWFIPNNNYYWSNTGLEQKRHFEFSLLSQFDLTKRFSVSFGIGYSRSKFVHENWGKPTTPALITDPIKSDQRILIIPIQAKFAFLQKNRFSLSAGLTFQGEIGRVISSEYPEEILTSTSFPSPQTEELLVVTKHRIQQFALEPFLQLSIGISPRLSTFANLGYRRYFGQFITGSKLPTTLNYFNADIGISIRIH